MSGRRPQLTLPSARDTKPKDSQQEAPTGAVRKESTGKGVLATLVGSDGSSNPTVASLPAPYDVAETVSPLTDKERADLEVCEQALHGFRKALIVAGKALEVIRRGRLYRERYGTFEDYVWEVWGIRRSQAYRLIDAWPVAVAVSPIGDINEAQARELLPVFKDHGRDAGVVFFRETAQLAGDRKVTAAALAEARKVLPARLAAPEQAADVLRVAAAEGRVPLIVQPKVEIPEQPAGDAPKTAAEVLEDEARAGAEAIAVLEAALAQQQQIYDRLAGIVSQALMYDPGRTELLLRQLREYTKRTAYRARGRAHDADAE